jgi:hypothetical protein
MNAPRESRVPGPSRGRLVDLAAVVAAFVVLVLVNVVAARHWKRIDASTGGRWTLSPASLATLAALEEPVHVTLLFGASDPLGQSVRHTLEAYTAASRLVEVESIDPDRDPLAFEDVRRRYTLEAGRTADGRVIADASIVVSRGDRAWFIAASDLVEVSTGDDMRARPREERALTTAIRRVLSGDRTVACFSTGHGEASVDDSGAQGLEAFATTLKKSNVEVRSVMLANAASLEACSLVVVAAPREAFTKAEGLALEAFARSGHGVFLAIGPLLAESGILETGLEAFLEARGIGIDPTLVVETVADRVVAGSRGLRFRAEVAEHPVTTGLAESLASRPLVVIDLARTLRHVPSARGVSAVDLLHSSPQAFALRDLRDVGAWRDVPPRGPSDVPGPHALAMLAEEKVEGGKVARVVVVGSSAIVEARSFAEPVQSRGGAFLTESIVAFLGGELPIVDVPEKQEIAAGLRITDEARASIGRYVLLVVPGAFAALGLAIAWLRRSRGGVPRGKTS